MPLTRLNKSCSAGSVPLWNRMTEELPAGRRPRPAYLPFIWLRLGPISGFISHHQITGLYACRIHGNRNLTELAVSSRVLRHIGEHVGLALVLQNLAQSLEQVVVVMEIDSA